MDMETLTYTTDEMAAWLPFPDRDANKYSRGKVVLVAGSARYPGAACLAACAAERMGAGYTEVLTDETAVNVVRASNPALVVGARACPPPNTFAPTSAERPLAYVVGPGFDAQERESCLWTYAVLEGAHACVLVDGGGLVALATETGRRLLRQRFIDGQPSVVTPHAGEAARLAAPFSLPADNPARLAQLISLSYGVVTVLKGPTTFISDGERVASMTEGTPALAKAGTGDVLAGMMGALLAQKMHPFEAGVLASTLHALAGRLAEESLTALCVGAQDVIAALPRAVKTLMKKSGPAKDGAFFPGNHRREMQI